MGSSNYTDSQIVQIMESQALPEPITMIDLVRLRQNQQKALQYEFRQRVEGEGGAATGISNPFGAQGPEGFAPGQSLTPQSLLLSLLGSGVMGGDMNGFQSLQLGGSIGQGLQMMFSGSGSGPDSIGSMLMSSNSPFGLRFFELITDGAQNIDLSSILQDVPTPLGEEDRKTLVIKPFSEITTDEIGRPELDMECTICRSQYEPADEVTILPCDGHHYYHKHCIDQWLSQFSKQCPVCKANIEDVLKSSE